jgi:hypothetical protein
MLKDCDMSITRHNETPVVNARPFPSSAMVKRNRLGYKKSAKIFTQGDASRHVQIDQLFNSTEKRLARTLLLLASYGKQGQPQKMLPKISQETLAGIIGTTGSRSAGSPH